MVYLRSCQNFSYLNLIANTDPSLCPQKQGIVKDDKLSYLSRGGVVTPQIFFVFMYSRRPLTQQYYRHSQLNGGFPFD